MLKELKEELKEAYSDCTPKEVIGDYAGWACLFGIAFMLSIIGG